MKRRILQIYFIGGQKLDLVGVEKDDILEGILDWFYGKEDVALEVSLKNMEYHLQKSTISFMKSFIEIPPSQGDRVH